MYMSTQQSPTNSMKTRAVISWSSLLFLAPSVGSKRSHVFCALKAPLKFAVQKFKSTLLSTVLTIMLSAPLVELTISTVQNNNIKQPIPQQTVYYIIRIDLNRRILSRSIRSHHINTGTHVPFRQRPFPLSVPFHTNSLSSGLPP